MDDKPAEDIRRELDAIHFQYWMPSYTQQEELLVCGGEQWELVVKYDDGTVITCGGDNTYSENWDV